MPIGVPKVPFRLPGDEDATWVDLYNRLYRERALFLVQDIEDEIANQLISIMVFLNGQDEDQNISLFINSPGGSIFAGFSLYDAMQFIKPHVYTVCLGIAASMASIVLIGGEITKRIALPNARVMIHQPASVFYDGQAGEFLLEAEEILRLRNRVTQIYRQRTGKPTWEISKDLERDVYMSAEQAKSYGIVDLVAVNVDSIVEFEKLPKFPTIERLDPEKGDLFYLPLPNTDRVTVSMDK
jgi:ATP-dependent Clp protease, protease subunit